MVQVWENIKIEKNENFHHFYTKSEPKNQLENQCRGLVVKFRRDLQELVTYPCDHMCMKSDWPSDMTLPNSTFVSAVKYHDKVEFFGEHTLITKELLVAKKLSEQFDWTALDFAHFYHFFIVCEDKLELFAKRNKYSLEIIRVKS